MLNHVPKKTYFLDSFFSGVYPLKAISMEIAPELQDVKG